MDNLVKVSSNWTQIGGCDFPQAIQLQTADPDVFLRPLLDDIVNEEKSLLLGKGDLKEYCELYVQLYPHYKIQAISLVCNVAKIEIFQGPLKEYLETIYGIIVDEADEQFKTYRYDLEVEKSGITDLTVKFLTNSCDVCIFGIILHMAPNPNGITTLVPNSASINIESVLKNSSKTLTPASEKCKQFLELMARTKMLPIQTSKTNSNTILNTLQQPTLEQLVKHCHVDHPQKINVDEQRLSRGECKYEDNIVNTLKLYIDERFQEMDERLNKHFVVMEERLNKQFLAMEERQMEKLDSILRILKKK